MFTQSSSAANLQALRIKVNGVSTQLFTGVISNPVFKPAAGRNSVVAGKTNRSSSFVGGRVSRYSINEQGSKRAAVVMHAANNRGDKSRSPMDRGNQGPHNCKSIKHFMKYLVENNKSNSDPNKFQPLKKND